MLKKILSGISVDAILITKPENIRYLTGFNGGSSYLLVTKKESFLLSHAIYGANCQKFTAKLIQLKVGTKAYAEIEKLINMCGIKKVGFESSSIVFDTLEGLKNDLKNIEFIPLKNTIDNLRMIKNKDEIKNIEIASNIASKVFVSILDMLRPGMSEQDVAAEIEFKIRKEGGGKDSFDPIVVSGVRSALPHAEPTNKLISKNELITIDFGVLYNGYCSDVTRTVVLGKASPEQNKIFKIVAAAQEKAIAKVKSGALCADIDTTARDYIENNGYKDNFIHSTGHGVGLEIHEGPRLGIGSKDKLSANMTITIEPGIYVPGFGGVRIEDTLLVTKNSSKILTDVPKVFEL